MKQEEEIIDEQLMDEQPMDDQFIDEQPVDEQPIDESSSLSFDQIGDDDLPDSIKGALAKVDKDSTLFTGNMGVAGAPSFAKATSGIETGNYQDLEHLDFGSINGSPAVSFTDEDGQRQALRVTLPQWTAMLQSRSQGRKELKQQYKLDAAKTAMKPQFNQLMKMVPNSQDPITRQAYDSLYEVDPQLAYNIAGSALGKDVKTGILFGREVPEQLAKAQGLLSQQQFKGKQAQFDNLAKGTQNIATLNGIQGVKNIIRPPEANHLPAEMTLSEWMDSNGMGAIPMLNAIQQSSLPMGIPNAPKPLQPPVPDKDGQYNQKQFMDWATGFNEMVVKPLGWSPYDLSNPQHVEALSQALHSYNASRMGAILTPPITPTVLPPQARPYSERPSAASAKAQGDAMGAAAEQVNVKTPVGQDVETLFERYAQSAFEEMNPQDDYPSDKKEAASAALEAIVKIHEQNMENKKNGKPLSSAIPPDVAEKIYNALEQK